VNSDAFAVAPAAVSDYLDVLHVERGLAAATVEAYRRDLRQYLDFLDLRPVSPDLVSEYVSHLQEVGLAPSSVARKVAAIRGLHRHLLAAGATTSDPTAIVDAPRHAGSLPKALTVDQVLALIESPNIATERGRRDSAVLEFLYATGARVSEAAALDALDCDLDEGTVLLTGKGNKQRIVPLGGAAREAIRRWLPDRARLRRSTAGGAVFLSMRGARMTRQGIWLVVRSAARVSGIPVDRVSPHVLRHSAATHMVEGGADLRSVQEMLGHATIATTQIYTRVSPQHLLEVYTTSHPRR
jgi:integrase/recombinase XerD